MTTRPRGPKVAWRPTTARQKGIFADLLARYQQHHDDDTLPRSPRGMFYDLRPAGMGNGVTYRKPDSLHPVRATATLPGFGPMEAHPAAVQEVLALARRAGLIPESWVADDRAVGAIGNCYDRSAEQVAAGLAESVRTAADTFALDPQRGQRVYVEVLCEAAGLMDRLARIANRHGVDVYSGSGFDGMKGKRAFADRAMARTVPTVVLHVGDYDQRGREIYVAAAEDAVAWAHRIGHVEPLDSDTDLGDLADDLADCGDYLAFVRLALTDDQGDDLGLLDADGKAEVDGVPVPVMDGWLAGAIEALHDPARREQLEAEQEQERGRLPGLIREALAGGSR